MHKVKILNQRNLINNSDATNPTYDTKSHAITTFNKQAKTTTFF